MFWFAWKKKKKASYYLPMKLTVLTVNSHRFTAMLHGEKKNSWHEIKLCKNHCFPNNNELSIPSAVLPVQKPKDIQDKIDWVLKFLGAIQPLQPEKFSNVANNRGHS